jgi:hypothetical protein
VGGACLCNRPKFNVVRKAFMLEKIESIGYTPKEKLEIRFYIFQSEKADDLFSRW